MSSVAIIIPTWDNPQYLYPCVDSLLMSCGIPIYIVNNGSAEYVKHFTGPQVKVLQQEKNLGWEGGLKKGIEASTEDFLLFLNDDTYIPWSSAGWLAKLLRYFEDPKVAAVGPSSNCVMGAQNIFSNPSSNFSYVNFLIGFCMMVRRSALIEAGGIDDTLPGGDDLDLSIRLRNVGYKLICDREVFVYHHGFKTGERVNGGPQVVGGWNSTEMMEKTNFALMTKHGLRAWMNCMNQMAVAQ